MVDYLHLRLNIDSCTETATDLLAAFLADIGYDSFVPDEKGLSAYIPADKFDDEGLKQMLADFPMELHINLKTEVIEGQDWNSEWEKNYFKPIVVGGECVIHSTFHKDVPSARYDIVIDPRMAFGTGHHATTSLMIEHILSFELSGKSVIDMGTGTGILAILCAMRGAEKCIGIEIDPYAAENAREHVELNDTPSVQIITGDASSLPETPVADLFIANINRNIILADLPAYVASLKKGGSMIFSGFYTEDVPLICAAAGPLGLKYVSEKTKDNWCAVRFVKQD